MRTLTKKLSIFLAVVMMTLIAACSGNKADKERQDSTRRVDSLALVEAQRIFFKQYSSVIKLF